METNDIKELKIVLSRIDEKLLSVRKIYSAISFTFWLMILLIYFAIFPNIKLSIGVTVVYWILAIIIYIRISSNITRKVNKLRGEPSMNHKKTYFKMVLLVLSWGAGIGIGWILVPWALSFLGNIVSLAIGFLLFITISLAAQYFFIFFISCKKLDLEILPSIVVPLVGIPGVLYMENNAMLWSGFVVAIGFTLTILLYLNSAFKSIG